MSFLTAWMVLLLSVSDQPLSGESAPAASGFGPATEFAERVKWLPGESGIRAFLNVPGGGQLANRVLVIFATPNGNTIEQTLGCTLSDGLDWHYDIQHVAAQIRQLRGLVRDRDVALSVVEAPRLSWPSFRQTQKNANAVIADLVEKLRKEVGAGRLVLSGHSGGGSFVFGFIEAFEAIPDAVERIVLLDANYAYADEHRHGDKLLAWLRGDASRRLVVIAYDDREVTLNGKKVVGPTGGTYRATQRMIDRFRRDTELEERRAGPFVHTRGLRGQIQLFVHTNPDNKILHTALVGEMNGLLHGLTLSTEYEGKWGMFGGPRSYTAWVQRQPTVERRPLARISHDCTLTRSVSEDRRARSLAHASGWCAAGCAGFDPAREKCGLEPVHSRPPSRLRIPPRPKAAPTGSQFCRQIARLAFEQREIAVRDELLQGNVPDHLRILKGIRLEATDRQGNKHVADCFVMPDYLAVGDEGDFFRVPMSPMTAHAVAVAWGGSLITPRIADAIFQQAELRLAPRPLTKDRESVETFFEHHQLIEAQRRGSRPGLLVAGIKKDVVLTNRLLEKAHRVAIYGWHQPDGRPIQPLYVGHRDTYVDYSHGIRFMSERLLVDGKECGSTEVLRDPALSLVLTDEGPLDGRVLATEQ